MNATARRNFFAVLKSHNPNPTTELKYGNHYQLLVAVVLSAQSTDVGVNRATRELFAKIKTPADMLKLGEKGLAKHISSVGLYKTKARNVLALSSILTKQHGGKVPRSREELEALPGVGRKTANVVLNTAFGEPTMAVDTHIFRVSNRTGLAPGKNVREVEDGLMRAVPKEYLQNAHHWLILHGRYVCKARTPMCAQCEVRKYCEFAKKNTGNSLSV